MDVKEPSEAQESSGSTSNEEASQKQSPGHESMSSSGQGTMISRISNPSVADQPAPDYMQALNSLKFIDAKEFQGPFQILLSRVGAQDDEDLKVEDIFDGSSGSGVRNHQQRRVVHKASHFSQEEEKNLEQQILRIRDKIRRGELLSCQIASQN